MWFKSKPKSEPDTVMCYQCGHIIAKERAYAVCVNGSSIWYCMEHRPAYDEKFYTYGLGGPAYYRRMQVDRDGIPIGYIEKPKDDVYQGYEKVPK